MSNPYTITLRRIYEDGGAHYIEVGPDGEGYGCVELRTVGDANEEFFGKFRLAIPKEMARELANALRECASEVMP